MTRPCRACGRTYLSAGPTIERSGRATLPPAPGARCRACVADDVYPCRCVHPAHRGICPSCDCRSNQPDRREGQSESRSGRRTHGSADGAGGALRMNMLILPRDRPRCCVSCCCEAVQRLVEIRLPASWVPGAGGPHLAVVAWACRAHTHEIERRQRAMAAACRDLHSLLPLLQDAVLAQASLRRELEAARAQTGLTDIKRGAAMPASRSSETPFNGRSAHEAVL